MRNLTQALLVSLLLACVGRAADARSKATNAGPVRLVFLGYTNEPVKGRLATFNLTNSLNHDIIHGHAVEEKTQAGWPVYPNGGRLPHSALEQLDAQTNITFSVAVPTNGRIWRVFVTYQNLQTRRDEDFGGLRTAFANTFRPKEKYRGYWLWSEEMSE